MYELELVCRDRLPTVRFVKRFTCDFCKVSNFFIWILTVCRLEQIFPQKLQTERHHLGSTRSGSINLFRLRWCQRVLRIFVSKSYNSAIHLVFAKTMSLTTLTRLQTPFFVFFSLDSQFRSINTLYTKPYTRISGYLAGVWTGYYLSNTNRSWNVRKVSTSLRLRHVSGIISVSSKLCCDFFSQAVFKLTRFIALFSFVFLVFIQRYKADSFWVSVLFPAAGRTLWAVAVCFLIMAGSTEFRNGLKQNQYLLCNVFVQIDFHLFRHRR